MPLLLSHSPGRSTRADRPLSRRARHKPTWHESFNLNARTIGRLRQFSSMKGFQWAIRRTHEPAKLVASHTGPYDDETTRCERAHRWQRLCDLYNTRAMSGHKA